MTGHGDLSRLKVVDKSGCYVRNWRMSKMSLQDSTERVSAPYLGRGRVFSFRRRLMGRRLQSGGKGGTCVEANDKQANYAR